MNKKIAVTLALTSLIALFAGTVRAGVNIDLTTASIGLAPQSSINISNISYGGAKYDATLQWNPVTANFDITTVALSSASAKKCSLGTIKSPSFYYGSSQADITLTSDSSARSITIAYTPKSAYSPTYYNVGDFTALWDFSVIQRGTQLYMTQDTGKLSTNTALLTELPDPTSGATVSWTSIPGGSTRYAQITKIPTWFNFSLPISSVYESGTSTTYNCL